MTTDFFLMHQFAGDTRSDWALGPGQHIVGRSARCDVVIFDGTISREHAKILVDEDAIRVVDLNSRNGTFIDGVRVQTGEALLGSTVQFGRIICVIADTRMLTEFADSEFSTLQYQPKTRDSRCERLSDAQKRVLDWLLEGLSEKEVAVRLDLSPNTVHHHITEIYRTLKVGSRAELLALFVLK